MKRNLLLCAVALITGSLAAADSNAKSEVQAAIKKLSEKASYSWTATPAQAGGQGGGGGGGRFRAGPVSGKTEKEGFTFVTTTRGENTVEAVMKGEKVAIKTAEGWRTAAEAGEAAGDQPNRGRALRGMFQNFRAPAAEAERLLAKVKELKKTDDVYTGDFTEEGVKELLSFGGRPGGEAPQISNPKGSARFWVKDGVLAKYEYKVQGGFSRNGNDVNIDRTTTVEIKDVGATKVEVPEEAKKKLS